MPVIFGTQSLADEIRQALEEGLTWKTLSQEFSIEEETEDEEE